MRRATRRSITANTLKPVECAGITLTTVVAGINGTGGADLLLGSSAVNSMSGGNGNDCILGGGGNDSINCGSGTDVAVGGPGTDTFNANCETRFSSRPSSDRRSRHERREGRHGASPRDAAVVVPR